MNQKQFEMFLVHYVAKVASLNSQIHILKKDRYFRAFLIGICLIRVRGRETRSFRIGSFDESVDLLVILQCS